MDVGLELTAEGNQFFLNSNLESDSSEQGRSNQHQRDKEVEMSESDCESSVSSSQPLKSCFFGDKTVMLDNDDKQPIFIKRLFLSGLGSLGKNINVIAIHRNTYSTPSTKARLQSFRIYADATAKQRGGNINMKCAWYGASKEEISGIIDHGFGRCEIPENGALFGSGVYLYPANSSIDSIISSVADESGLRHVLLCRVILGNVEEIPCGSKQFRPSSEEFDSGVDNLSNPNRYILWGTHMNTHIMPEFVLSFRGPTPRGSQRGKQPVKKPTSAWMPFSKLIVLLSEYLHPTAINLIKKYYNDYQAKKITRDQMIKRVRLIAGDKLLASAIRSFRSKVSPPVAM